jgi:hypothetical protein
MRDYTFKAANMKKEQEFTLYPYTGGDYIYLQSDKRFSRVNLRTGAGIINAKNRNYANSIHLQLEPLPFTLPEDIKLKIQGYLWHNEGKEGNISGICFFENKELFSEPA